MWPFKKKPKDDSALVKYLEKEAMLHKEGWIPWIARPPFEFEAVYARRIEEDAVDIIYPAKLHPAFNIAGLWWLPHHGENRLN